MSFKVIDVQQQPWDVSWRPGVKTRNWSAEIDGARELHIGEQFFEPGKGVPSHWHSYEEHLILLDGTMEFCAEGETHRVSAPACVVVHAKTAHSFTAVGEVDLHILGAISSAVHETYFEHFGEGEAIRQYEADFPEGARRKVRVDPQTLAVDTLAL